MVKAKKRKPQQGYDVAKAIDSIEKVVSKAMRIYKAVEPIAKAIITKERKTK